jgi:prepilin-type N-terminal cleavage/methylation domain-containing protein
VTTKRSRRAEGFTLIEVLVAMVLLAIGLMALQGMGIMAIKSVGFAERNTRAAAMASEWTEDGLNILRSNLQPEAFSCTLANGDQVERTLDVANPNLPRVTVTVTPEPRGGTPQPYALSSSVFLPNGVSPNVSNATHPCK